MKVTIKLTGKHGGLSWVAGGAVTVENMVYKQSICASFEVVNGLVMLFTNINVKISHLKIAISPPPAPMRSSTRELSWSTVCELMLWWDCVNLCIAQNFSVQLT